MNRDVLLGAGVVLAFIVLVNRAKKNQVTDTEGGGGGGGGGGFGPMGPIGPIGPLPMTPNVVIQNIPRPVNQGRSYTAEEATKSKDTTPTAASTSSTSAGAMSGVGVSNTDGIVPISQGGSTTPRQTGSVVQISQADLNKGISGGTVFKPFSGDAKFLGFVGSRPKFEFN
jgi:hypothetical protein